MKTTRVVIVTALAMVCQLGCDGSKPALDRSTLGAQPTTSQASMSPAQERRLKELHEILERLNERIRRVSRDEVAKTMSSSDLPLLACLLTDDQIGHIAVDAMGHLDPDASILLMIQYLPRCPRNSATWVMYFLQRQVDKVAFPRAQLRVALLELFSRIDHDDVWEVALDTFGMVAKHEDLPTLRALREKWEKELAAETYEPRRIWLNRKLTADQRALARLGDERATKEILAELQTPLVNNFFALSTLSMGAGKAAYSRQVVFVPALVHILEQEMPQEPLAMCGCLYPGNPHFSAIEALCAIITKDQQPKDAEDWDKKRAVWLQWWEHREHHTD